MLLGFKLGLLEGDPLGSVLGELEGDLLLPKLGDDDVDDEGPLEGEPLG